MTASVCLNADLGEMPGGEGRKLDAAMLAVITRCNVACGGHAGDADTMRETVRVAKSLNVRIGAHPSYPDTEHFGRRSLNMDIAELEASLEAQIRLLIDIARAEHCSVLHMKAHGALYNDAAKDASFAQMIAAVAARAGIPELIGPPESEFMTAARGAGLQFLAEGIADRSYEPDGALTPRSLEGAVLEETHAVLAQALMFAREGRVKVRGGGERALAVQTICLHSDTPGAADHARAIRSGLEAAGILVRA